jgi:hypothetical protein
MGDLLAEQDRCDLHEERLALLGIADIAPARVERFLREANDAFDLAIAVKKTPPGDDRRDPGRRP